MLYVIALNRLVIISKIEKSRRRSLLSSTSDNNNRRSSIEQPRWVSDVASQRRIQKIQQHHVISMIESLRHHLQ